MNVNTTQLINLISHNVQSTPGVFWDDKFNIYHKDPVSKKEIKYTFKLLKFWNATVTKEPEFSYYMEKESIYANLELGIDVCYTMDA